MKKALLLAVVLLCVVSLVGCHPKKLRPLEPAQKEPVKTPAAQVTKEVPEKPQENPIKPIEPAEGEAALKDIHFDYDKYNLTDEASRLIGDNAAYLMSHPDVKIVIEGNCDERGTEEYNLALGEKRALTARDYLVRFGIDKSRISIISYGEERPLDPASNEEAWAKNRRDHFAVK